MNERRFSLSWSVLDLQTEGDHALGDWLSVSDSVSTIRICLEDRDQQGLAAALTVLDARLQLSDGRSVGIEQRLLADGGVDIDGRDGEPAAEALVIPRLPRGAHTAFANATGAAHIGVAARLSRNGDAAVMLVGVAPHPIRARQLESVLRGRSLDDRIIDLVAQTARTEAQPHGVGDATDVGAIAAVENAVRRLGRRLRDRLDEGESHVGRHRARRW